MEKQRGMSSSSTSADLCPPVVHLLDPHTSLATMPIQRTNSTPSSGLAKKVKPSSKKMNPVDLRQLKLPVVGGPAPSSPATATVASSTPIATPRSTPTPARVDVKPQQTLQPQGQPRVEIKRGLGLEHAFVAVPAPAPVVPEKRGREDDDDNDSIPHQRRRIDRGLTPAPQSKGTNTWTGNLEDQVRLGSSRGRRCIQAGLTNSVSTRCR